MVNKISPPSNCLSPPNHPAKIQCGEMERAIAHRVSHLCYWLTKWVRVNNCSINSKSSAQNWKAKAWKSDAWLQHSIFKWTKQKHLSWCIDITSWHPLILVVLGFHFKPKTSDSSNSKHWTLQLRHTPPIILFHSITIKHLTCF